MVLGSIKSWLLGGTVLAFVAVGGFAAWQTYQVARQETQIVQLVNDNQTLRNNVKSLEMREAAQQAANDILADRIAKQREANEELQNELEIIYETPEEFDGPIAPILRDYLDRLSS